MKNDKHPRTEPGIFRLPVALKEKVEQVAAREHRSISEMFYYLTVRGLKAYLQDGIVIEDSDDELAFLDTVGTPMITARQRSTSKRARV